ncbi:hypothetical protein [Streptomyces griseiscabiei]|uniref:hypothetical protein n=1 Tax=Streptomyces griseiscabiei TaxID=2993540 RepID=UPI00117C05BC|nr:hypothetical protein [Streptomyces griseiscabiei]
MDEFVGDDLVEGRFVGQWSAVVEGPGGDDRLVSAVGGLEGAGENQGPGQDGDDSRDLEPAADGVDLLGGQVQVGDVAGQGAVLVVADLLPPRGGLQQAEAGLVREGEAGGLLHHGCDPVEYPVDLHGQGGMASGFVEHGEAGLGH